MDDIQEYSEMPTNQHQDYNEMSVNHQWDYSEISANLQTSSGSGKLKLVGTFKAVIVLKRYLGIYNEL